MRSVPIVRTFGASFASSFAARFSTHHAALKPTGASPMKSRQAFCFASILLLAMFAGCELVPAFARPDVSPQTRVASMKQAFTRTLNLLSDWRVAGIIDDDNQRTVRDAREAGLKGLQTAQGLVDLNNGHPDPQTLADVLDQVNAELAKLLGVKAKVAPAAKAKGLTVPDDPKVVGPVIQQTAQVELIAFEVIGAIAALLRLATDKAQQAANEGRALTPEEIDEIENGLDLSVARSRALDPKDT
jgi:hypothetical protein